MTSLRRHGRSGRTHRPRRSTLLLLMAGALHDGLLLSWASLTWRELFCESTPYIQGPNDRNTPRVHRTRTDCSFKAEKFGSFLYTSMAAVALLTQSRAGGRCQQNAVRCAFNVERRCLNTSLMHVPSWITSPYRERAAMASKAHSSCGGGGLSSSQLS